MSVCTCLNVVTSTSVQYRWNASPPCSTTTALSGTSLCSFKTLHSRSLFKACSFMGTLNVCSPRQNAGLKEIAQQIWENIDNRKYKDLHRSSKSFVVGSEQWNTMNYYQNPRQGNETFVASFRGQRSWKHSFFAWFTPEILTEQLPLQLLRGFLLTNNKLHFAPTNRKEKLGWKGRKFRFNRWENLRYLSAWASPSQNLTRYHNKRFTRVKFSNAFAITVILPLQTGS